LKNYAHPTNIICTNFPATFSTSVPGLYAKPILDIDIIIEDKTLLGGITARLEELGYKAEGEQGIPERFAFRSLMLCTQSLRTLRHTPAYLRNSCRHDARTRRHHA